MSYETILYDNNNHITNITLNRPEKLNAMNHTMLAELADAVDVFEADDDAWVAIISGSGRSFSAGRDVQTIMPEGRNAERSNVPGVLVDHLFWTELKAESRLLQRFAAMLMALVCGWQGNVL